MRLACQFTTRGAFTVLRTQPTRCTRCLLSGASRKHRTGGLHKQDLLLLVFAPRNTWWWKGFPFGGGVLLSIVNCTLPRAPTVLLDQAFVDERLSTHERVHVPKTTSCSCPYRWLPQRRTGEAPIRRSRPTFCDPLVFHRPREKCHGHHVVQER